MVFKKEESIYINLKDFGIQEKDVLFIDDDLSDNYKLAETDLTSSPIV